MAAERVVLDTNVLISATLVPGTCFRVLQRVLADGALIFSDATFEELSTRLLRPKFDRYLSQARRIALLAELESVAEWTAIAGSLKAAADPDDDKLLETALAGHASWMVSGDQHLLVRDPFRGLRVSSPAGFLDLVLGAS